MKNALLGCFLLSIVVWTVLLLLGIISGAELYFAAMVSALLIGFIWTASFVIWLFKTGIGLIKGDIKVFK